MKLTVAVLRSMPESSVVLSMKAWDMRLGICLTAVTWEQKRDEAIQTIKQARATYPFATWTGIVRQ